MNLKTVLTVGVGLLVLLFGYNYYSSKKTADQIATYQAQANKAKQEQFLEESLGSSAQRGQIPQALPARDYSASNYSANSYSASSYSGYSSYSRSYSAVASRDMMLARQNQAYATANSTYESRRDMYDIYRKLQNSTSQMASLGRTASSAKGADRDTTLERMRGVRAEIASIDTKNSACAAESKIKILVALDAAIEATHASFSRSRDTSTADNARSKSAVANEFIQTCMSSTR